MSESGMMQILGVDDYNVRVFTYEGKLADGFGIGTEQWLPRPPINHSLVSLSPRNSRPPPKQTLDWLEIRRDYIFPSLDADKHVGSRIKES